MLIISFDTFFLRENSVSASNGSNERSKRDIWRQDPI